MHTRTAYMCGMCMFDLIIEINNVTLITVTVMVFWGPKPMSSWVTFGLATRVPVPVNS